MPYAGSTTPTRTRRMTSPKVGLSGSGSCRAHERTWSSNCLISTAPMTGLLLTMCPGRTHLTTNTCHRRSDIADAPGLRRLCPDQTQIRRRADTERFCGTAEGEVVFALVGHASGASYARSTAATRTRAITSPNIGVSPSGSDAEQARRWSTTSSISGSRRRSTVMREREQPLQTTSNTRLNSSGKSSPFCAHRLDVPVHLLAEIGKAPQDGTGWHQAFRQAQVAMGVRGEYFPCDPCREQPELRSALHTVAVVRLAKGGCQRLDEPKAASDLGRISRTKPIGEDGELEATEDRDAEGAAEAMPLLSETVPDEIVVREGEDVGGMAVHAMPPVTAALPLACCWRTRRRYDDALTPSSLEAARTGSFWLTTMRSWCSSTLRRGLPSFLPSLRARRRPAFTRSTISERSSWAMAAMIVKIAWPRGPLPSICSLRLINSTPRWRKTSSVSTKCRTERPRRSSAATTTTSTFRALTSAISLSRAGRRSRVPETPMSVNSRTSVQPRARQYSRRSQSWLSHVWSPVETRA